MQHPEIILGVDPGSIITGYGLLTKEGSSFQVIDYGCIRPPKTASLSDRYRIIFEGIQQLMQTHRPTVCAVETQFVGKNVQSAIKLGMARGMIVLAASLQGIPLFEYAPTRVKQAVVGQGRASKVQVQHMLKLLLRLHVLPTPEDAADALALALCHGHRPNGTHYV